jgi:hypothetical protein
VERTTTPSAAESFFVRDIVIGRSPLLNRQPHCGPEYLWIIVPERFLNEGREAGAKNQEKESLSQGIGQGADHAPGGREHRGDPLLGEGGGSMREGLDGGDRVSVSLMLAL